MGNLSAKQAVIAAIKSDTLSILTFEIGLFGWMALTFFVFFPNAHLRPTQAGYWFMMQIGMILGFFTSYPMNRWLIVSGWGPLLPASEPRAISDSLMPFRATLPNEAWRGVDGVGRRFALSS
jgi:hypothetical protein